MTPRKPAKREHLRLVPLTLAQANDLIARLHRHHKPVVGHRFSIGAEGADGLVGAVVVGRPVARMTNQYRVAEVTRLVTNGTRNACSLLYAAAARAAEAIGFDRIQTFILDTEPGTSLLAAGWSRDDHQSAGGDWNRPSRGGRRIDQPQQAKTRWSKILRAKRRAEQAPLKKHKCCDVEMGWWACDHDGPIGACGHCRDCGAKR